MTMQPMVVETAEAVDLSVQIGRLRLENPIMPASGCFGPEIAPLLGPSALGAVVTKTVFPQKRSGNAAPRLAETPYGMLNSVGIPSPGTESFRTDVLPRYRAFGVPVIVSIGGLFTHEYFTIAEGLADEQIDAFEVNVSCPNLEHGGLAIGTSPDKVFEVVSGIRKRLNRPIAVKLTPTIADISDVAIAAQEAGADALVVANSFSGLGIDIYSRTSSLGNGAGGYTGPAIKPLALKLVRDAAAHTTVPIIGCGGITSATDVAEFMIAGATAVQVGTANFTRPAVMNDILADLPRLCRELGVDRIAELTGTLDNSKVQEIG